MLCTALQEVDRLEILLDIALYNKYSNSTVRHRVNWLPFYQYNIAKGINRN